MTPAQIWSFLRFVDAWKVHHSLLLELSVRGSKVMSRFVAVLALLGKYAFYQLSFEERHTFLEVFWALALLILHFSRINSYIEQGNYSNARPDFVIIFSILLDYQAKFRFVSFPKHFVQALASILHFQLHQFGYAVQLDQEALLCNFQPFLG